MQIRKILAGLLLTLVAVLPLAAQNNPKKVAVWETKCSDGSLSSMQRLMIRGGMETYVGNSDGYEVYDRSAFDVIMKEHGFERTGAVNEEEIKEMGKLAGVQYIIVPEAMAEGNDIYILVKMLDVELGKFGGVQEELCASSSSEIKKACEKLGARLFGRTVGGSNSSTGVARQGQSPLGDYVDLGLPSGTKWKRKNEKGLYTYDEAVQRFGNNLPGIDQLSELKSSCTWTWNGSGYKVTGPNGNSILLPAAGFRLCGGYVSRVGSYGFYWSSTPNGSDKAWYLYFFSGTVNLDYNDRCYGNYVRLVQD